MNILLTGLLGIHVTAGFIGLAAFWVPIFTRKGGHYHRLLGKVFKYCAYLVLAAAGAAVIVRLLNLISSGATPADQPVGYAFLLFLGYLSWVTFVILRHGLLVLSNKPSLQAMDTTMNRTLAILSIAASALLIIYAVYFSPPIKIILLALSPIGVLSGIGILNAIRGRVKLNKAWMYEHLGAMIGCGIAFHTAFAVFGFSRIFDVSLPGNWQVLPWVLPSIIGIPATIIWTRVYKRKFGEA